MTDNGISVVVPAHNEAEVIVRCLRSLFAGNDRPIEVIVACNGCTDATEDVASGFDPRVRVVVSDVASKHAALNLGDRSASHALRCYVDADVELSPGALDRVAAHLETGGAVATAPRIRFEPTGSVLARAYLRVWEANPYFQQGLIGSGFYAFGADGRARFDEFPPIVADDMFVHGLFSDRERTVTPGATFVPLMPESLRSIVSVHLRHFGAHKEFERWADDTGTEVVLPTVGGPGWLLGQWRNPLGVATYVVVKVAAQIGGRLKYHFGDMGAWNRGR